MRPPVAGTLLLVDEPNQSHNDVFGTCKGLTPVERLSNRWPHVAGTMLAGLRLTGLSKAEAARRFRVPRAGR